MGLQDFINNRLAPEFYANPERLFAWEWRRRQGKQIAAIHGLTDGHRAHDKNGTYIREIAPYLIVDGSGGGSREFVTLYKETHNIGTYTQAAREIADIYGVPFDVDDWGIDEAQERRYKTRRTDMTDVAQMCLKTDANSPEADYLRGRGISDEARGDYYLFGVNAETEPILRAIYSRHKEAGDNITFPSGVAAGGMFTVGIPIICNGTLCGFDIRALPEREGDHKFTSMGWRSKRDGTVHNLHYATGREPKTLIIVEGALDCIVAQGAAGKTYDVVAVMGNSLLPEQAKEIAAAGYKNIIHAVDFDGVAKTAKTISYVEQTRKTAEEAGLTMLAADLIDEAHPTEKQDANSFVHEFGVEAFMKRIKAAAHPTTFICKKIARAAEPSDEGRVKARQAILEQLRQEPSADVVGDILADATSPVVKLFGDPEGLRVSLVKEKQAAKVAAEYTAAAEAAKAGNFDEAQRHSDRAQRLKEGGGEDPLDKWFEPQSWEEMVAQYRRQREGLHTGLYLRHSLNDAANDMEELIIPSGAITCFTAPRGHGKTKTLQNMVLIAAAAAQAEGKSIIAIHYEESTGDYLNNLISITANKAFTSRNRLYIREHMQLGEAADSSFRAAMETVRGYYENGTIIPIGTNPTIEQICRAVEEGVREDKLAAVVVDYLQRVPTEAKAWNRKDQLATICAIFNQLSRDSGIPFISASQFNRTVQAPTDMCATANADAAEIEQYASLNIGLWSSDEEPAAASRTWYDANGRRTREAEELTKAGLIFRDSANYDTSKKTLYMRVLKDREGSRQLWNVFEFDGNIGRIKTLER